MDEMIYLLYYRLSSERKTMNNVNSFGVFSWSAFFICRNFECLFNSEKENERYTFFSLSLSLFCTLINLHRWKNKTTLYLHSSSALSIEQCIIRFTSVTKMIKENLHYEKTKQFEVWHFIFYLSIFVIFSFCIKTIKENLIRHQGSFFSMIISQ
jgi:hypothetical protein